MEVEKVEDERGFFARILDVKKFAEVGLNTKIVQSSISHNKKKGTLRGMHYQAKPYEEDKIICCVKGKIFDVIVDIRQDSPTYKKWFGVELDANEYKTLYVPKGFAHGFQTLEDDVEVFYQMSEFFMPEYARGIRWNDEAIKIEWPLKPSIISKRDLSYDSFK
ncbi:MAG: dTDP-4-dehydrorhamnose 3,5-epimerase [Candidatus Nitrosotenuis sp.]